MYSGESYFSTNSSIEQPPIDNFPSPPIEVVIGTMFLLGLLKSTFFFRNDFFEKTLNTNTFIEI